MFLDSIILRYVTYNSETETLNAGNHNDQVMTTKWVSPQRFAAFLKSDNKDQYWFHKIRTNKQYKTQIRHFMLEKRLNKAFE